MSMLVNMPDALVKVQSMDAGQLKEIFGQFHPVKGRVAGALYNTDTDGVKNAILHSNPAGLMTGLKIAATLSGAQGAVLIVDCDVNEQELQANANMAGLPLEIERASIVDKRAHSDDELYCFDELAALAERLMGQTPGCFTAVDGGVPEELPPETTVGSLLPEGAKGAIADHRFIDAEKLSSMTLAQLKSKSGAIKTIGQGDCVVDLLKKEILKLRGKSCGKCVYCREGLYQIEQTVQEIITGRPKTQNVDLARELSQYMTFSCNCTLGDNAGMPVLTAFENFPKEMEAHVKRKECPAGVCLALTQFYVDPNKCVGCGACIEVCPESCIEGKPGYISMIESFDCTRCGKCLEACPNGAIVKTSGRVPKLPTKLTRAKGAKAVPAAQETMTEEAAPQEKSQRSTPRRRRNPARAGASAPATQAQQTSAEPAPVAAPETAPKQPETEPVQDIKPGLKVVGKRKRVYAKPKDNSGNK